MEIRQRITPAVIQAATGLLAPFIPEISPQTLIKALSDYDTGEKSAFVKPLTRREAAAILGISMPTINRLLNAGTLRRIYITGRAVRVDPDSVKALLSGTPVDTVEG